MPVEGTPIDVGNGLVSVAYVKSLPSMSVAAVISDELLTNVILAVSQAAERYCNRSFKAADYTEVLDGDGTEELILGNFPIIGALTSLSVLMYDNVTVDTFNVATDVLLKPESGVIYVNKRSVTTPLLAFPRGKQNVTVAYRAGFETVPAAVQQGVAEWVADVCLRTTRDPSLSAETIKGYSWEARKGDQYDSLSEPPAVARMLLSTYRNIHT